MFVQVATQDAVVWDSGRMGGEASVPRKVGIAGAVSAIANASAMTAAGLFRKMRCAFPLSAGAAPQLAPVGLGGCRGTPCCEHNHLLAFGCALLVIEMSIYVKP